MPGFPANQAYKKKIRVFQVNPTKKPHCLEYFAILYILEVKIPYFNQITAL
jgi:hypothetical protein